MLYYMGLFFLVAAVSMDGLVVGMTYGLRKVRVPLQAIFIIMSCSGAVVFLAMTIGKALRLTISPDVTTKIGGMILICIGLFSIWNSMRSKKELSMKIQSSIASKNSSIPAKIGSILSSPSKADIDHSGRISMTEAFILGVALSMDAFGAGFGAAMLGYTAFMTTVLIAVMSGGFLFAGLRIGTVFSQYKMMQKFVYVPAMILIIIGASSFF